MKLRTEEILGTLSGVALVGIGAGTATVVAFQARLPGLLEVSAVGRTAGVALGFALFFAGVGLTQRAIHGYAGGAGWERLDAVQGAFLLAGVIGLAIGLILFAETVIQGRATLGLLSGVVCMGAYLAGHVGMNGSII